MCFVSTLQNEGLVQNYLSEFLQGKKYNFHDSLKLLEEKMIFHYLETSGITKITCEDSQVILSFQNGQSLSH